ncbi:hypothetical protein ACNOYE_08185 [Nannocystaceae bacterium ST9]
MTLARQFGLTPSQARVALGALRAVVEADGPADEREAEFLSVAAQTLELATPWTAQALVEPAQAAELFASEPARRLLIFALILAACIDTKATPASVALVRRFASELGVESRWVGALEHASRRRVLPTKLALYRSSPDAVRLFQRTWAEEGMLGLVRALRFVLAGGSRELDPALAWRFRQLGLLPEGTLGRMFWIHMRSRAMAFPGERGGLPERMIHHDLLHAVTGYDTDAAGECQLAGFYAGFTPGEPFTFVMTVLTTFHLGMPVSPPIVRPAVGAFDPAKFIAAFERGRKLRVDVMGRWDYWELMPLPLAEVHARLGIEVG